jgi:hypothetical protein
MQDFRYLEMEPSTVQVKLNKDAKDNIVEVLHVSSKDDPINGRRTLCILYCVSPRPGRESVSNQSRLF